MTKRYLKQERTKTNKQRNDTTGQKHRKERQTTELHVHMHI